MLSSVPRTNRGTPTPWESRQLLKNKYVVIIGDSNSRAMYKDLIYMLRNGALIPEVDMKKYGEPSYQGDRLLCGGGKKLERIPYKEEREYKDDDYWIRFYFINRCYSTYVEHVIGKISPPRAPDIVIVSSMVWDLRPRRGCHWTETYPQYLFALFQHLKANMPTTCLLLWCLYPPVDNQAPGMKEEHRLFLTPSNNHNANIISAQVAIWCGMKIVDLYSLLHYHGDKRNEDGVHWNSEARRLMTNLTLIQIRNSYSS